VRQTSRESIISITVTEDTIGDAEVSCTHDLCCGPTTPTGLLRTPTQKKPQILDLGY